MNRETTLPEESTPSQYESPMDVKGQFGVDGDAARHDMKGPLENVEDRLLLGHRCDHFDEVGCSSERRAGKSLCRPT